MRLTSIFALSLAAACGSSGGSGGGTDAPGTGDTPAFEITTPDVTLTPGQEVTYCYYFHTPNTTPIAVNKWVSDMTAGSHHLILYTGGPDHADGLDMSNSCGLGTSAQNPPIWVYASQVMHDEQNLPTDDGAGMPLAQKFAPNTLGAIQMHYLNSSDNTIMAHHALKAYALPDGTAFTQTDAYITYNNSITIGPGATGVTVSATCTAPTQNFWLMGTHAHKQAVHTDVKNATSMVFQSSDWEHPGTQTWNAAPYYSFTGGKLTWECTYDNTGDNKNNTVVAGPSAATNEMCMAVGYYFPSTGAKICLYDDRLPGDHCYCQ